MSGYPELLYIKIERLTCREEDASTPAPRYFVSIVDSEYALAFAVWDGALYIDALQAAVEWGLPVFDMTGGAK